MWQVYRGYDVCISCCICMGWFRILRKRAAVVVLSIS
jgi:hypothetical protein